MRFNLENRPKCDDYAGEYVIYERDGKKYKGYCHRDMEKWFRGFKRQEQRKNKRTAIKIEELGNAKQIPLEQLGFLRGYLQRGKEILGES